MRHEVGVLLSLSVLQVVLETLHDEGGLADRKVDIVQVELETAKLNRLIKLRRDHADNLIVEIVFLDVPLNPFYILFRGHLNELHLHGCSSDGRKVPHVK